MAFSPRYSTPVPVRTVLKPATSVRDVLTSPPSKIQGDVARRQSAHLVAAQEKGGRLEITTSWKPQTWVRVSTGQTPSSCTADRRVRERSVELLGKAEEGGFLPFICPTTH